MRPHSPLPSMFCVLRSSKMSTVVANWRSRSFGVSPRSRRSISPTLRRSKVDSETSRARALTGQVSPRAKMSTRPPETFRSSHQLLCLSCAARCAPRRATATSTSLREASSFHQAPNTSSSRSLGKARARISTDGRNTASISKTVTLGNTMLAQDRMERWSTERWSRVKAKGCNCRRRSTSQTTSEGSSAEMAWNLISRSVSWERKVEKKARTAVVGANRTTDSRRKHSIFART